MKSAQAGTATVPANPRFMIFLFLIVAEPHAGDERRRVADEPRIAVIVGRAGLARGGQLEPFRARAAPGAAIHHVGQHARHQVGGARPHRAMRPALERALPDEIAVAIFDAR